MSMLGSPIPVSDIEAVLAWVDTFKLSKPTKKINRDFSDGVLLAEILAVHYPKLVEMHNYPPRNSHALKLNNWMTLNRKVLKRLKLNLCSTTMEQLANSAPGIIERVLIMVRDKIKRDEELEKSMRDPENNVSSGGSYYEACGDDEGVLVVPVKARVNGVLETIQQKVVSFEVYSAMKEELKDTKDASNILKQKVEHLDSLLKLKDERITELQKQLERKQSRRKEMETLQNTINVPFEEPNLVAMEVINGGDNDLNKPLFNTGDNNDLKKSSSIIGDNKPSLPKIPVKTEDEVKLDPTVKKSNEELKVPTPKDSMPKVSSMVNPQVQNSMPKVSSMVNPQVQNSMPKVSSMVNPQVQNSMTKVSSMVNPQVQNSMTKVSSMVNPQVQNSMPKVSSMDNPQVQNSMPKVSSMVNPQVQNSVPKVSSMVNPQVQNSIPKVSSMDNPQVPVTASNTNIQVDTESMKDKILEPDVDRIRSDIFKEATDDELFKDPENCNTIESTIMRELDAITWPEKIMSDNP